MITAITRKISPAFNQCELTLLNREPIDIEKANEQHAQYENALRSLGVEVISLPEEEGMPDSVFVEDAAVVLDEAAIITRPGAPSRRAEVASIERALAPFRKIIRIQAPGTLDGGDVLVIGKTIYVGISSRSNPEAIQQLQTAVKQFGYTVEGVEVTGCLHLKSAVTRVAEKTILINPNWVDKKIFLGSDFIEIDEEEPYAANGLLIRNQVIYPDAFAKTLAKIVQAGIKVITLDVSEIAKAEGAVTCCSLIIKS
jgi:dimethylargininase